VRSAKQLAITDMELCKKKTWIFHSPPPRLIRFPTAYIVSNLLYEKDERAKPGKFRSSKCYSLQATNKSLAVTPDSSSLVISRYVCSWFMQRPWTHTLQRRITHDWKGCGRDGSWLSLRYSEWTIRAWVKIRRTLGLLYSFFWVIPRRWILYADVSEHCLFHFHMWCKGEE